MGRSDCSAWWRWRLAHALRRRVSWDDACVLVPALAVIGVAMMSDLDYGLRYLLPAMPFLCVWIGGLLAPQPEAAAAHERGPARPKTLVRAWAVAALALFAAEGIECTLATPGSSPTSTPSRAAAAIASSTTRAWTGTGPDRAARRDEGRGIRDPADVSRHHDPALYGIDYIPYKGGAPEPGSNGWR